MKTNKLTKYLNEYSTNAESAKRWHLLLFVLGIIFITAIIIFLPDRKQPPEEIANHKALVNSQVQKVAAYVKLQTARSNKESERIALFLLYYYWRDENMNPKNFTINMVELLGKGSAYSPTGDKEFDAEMKNLRDEITRDLEKEGFDPNLIERKERLTLKVEFLISKDINVVDRSLKEKNDVISGTDVFNIFLPNYDIERVNTR